MLFPRWFLCEFVTSYKHRLKTLQRNWMVARDMFISIRIYADWQQIYILDQTTMGWCIQDSDDFIYLETIRDGENWKLSRYHLNKKASVPIKSVLQKLENITNYDNWFGWKMKKNLKYCCKMLTKTDYHQYNT